jgi:hypothetical protein
MHCSSRTDTEQSCKDPFQRPPVRHQQIREGALGSVLVHHGLRTSPVYPLGQLQAVCVPRASTFDTQTPLFVQKEAPLGEFSELQKEVAAWSQDKPA